MGRSNGTVIPGTLKVGRHKYSYELGDLILRYGGATFFSGIDVHLPKRLPHIYLDSKQNDRVGRSREFEYDRENAISLEGNFNEAFKAYAPKEHKALALSILGPDVLQTLLDSAHDYDVEIIENHVRLIVRGVSVSRSEQLKEELLAAAHAIMKEVDHKLKSWHEGSLVGDTALDVTDFNKHFTQ
ncbi:MAG TPA: hypothetical protein VLA92_03395 [Candidatus Saccharimonadales bacterium]|nr:hypothetical protein [Candidatus Saccharimonadales bacterium]